MNLLNVKHNLNWFKFLFTFAFILFVIQTKLYAQPVTFSYTGAVQTYTVPPCVTSVAVTAAGAKGGGAVTAAGNLIAPFGGNGATVNGLIIVTPGQSLEIWVGGSGNGTTAGFNGGGLGKTANGANFASFGGGGASDIRVAPYGLANRVIVAAGGGGAGGGDFTLNSGGNGGCQTGTIGGTELASIGGGGAGTQINGGAGGSPYTTGNWGIAGTLGQGGNGVTDPCFNRGPSGGGGSGKYGGGSGGSDCFNFSFFGGAGGGGGSSLIPTGGNCVPGNNNSTAGGYVTITPIIGNITVTANPIAPFICQGASVEITASGALTYVWSPNTALSLATGDTVIATPAAATTYTVTGTDATGCTGTATVNVDFLPTPSLTTIVNPSAICLGDTAIVTVSGATNCTWTGNYLFANAANDSIWVSPTATETFTVSATGANGCVGSQIDSVVVNPLPNANAGLDETICVGGSATLNASGGITYSWSPANGLSATNINNPTATPSNTETYTVLVTDANGCQNTDDIIINAVPLPIANPGANVGVCIGGSITLNGSGGTSFIWSPATGLSDPTIANPVCTPAATSNYTLTVTSGNCTSIPSAPITVTVYNQPAAPLINVNGPITFCQGNSVILTSSVATNNFWSTGATSNSITVTTSGTYTVYYLDANGCSSAVSAAVNVLVNPLPAAPIISANGTLTVCPGGSVDLTSSVANAYTWSNGNNTQTITVSTSGNYNVTISDINGCTATSTNTLFTVLPTPAIPILTASGPLSFCTGDSVTLSSSPAASYLWSNGATTQSITVLGSGSYSITNGTINGCATPTSAITNTVMFPVPPAPVITAGGPITFCYGNNVVLTSSVALGYLWSNAFTTQSITVSSAGTYNLSIFDANGCPSPLSSDVIVTVNTLPQSPTISAVGPTTFCIGQSVTLQSSQPSGNLWSTGSTADNINVSTSGNYSVSFIDANNCASLSSNPVMVTAMALAPTPTISTSGSTTFCENDSLVITCSPAQTFLWSTGETTPSITVSAAGTYTVSVTDVCNPLDPFANIVINVNPNPVANFLAPVLVDCLPSSIEFVNTSIDIEASIWNFGDGGVSNETNPAYMYQFPGLYNVSLTVLDSNGCTHTKTRNEYIQIFPPAEIRYTISPQVTNLLNSNIVFQNNTENCASQEWDLGIYGSSTSNTYSYTFEDVGTYYVGLSVATEDGCIEQITDSVVIEDNYVIYFPTSFTPNGDGLNDLFMPLGGGIEEFKLEIYNRWGNVIFTTVNKSQAWDGYGHGQDNYIWKVYLKDNKGVDREMIGSVTLLR